ncbi:interleukin-18 receptor 1 [Pyxicephalus adspersus]|uniref:interleukin-18 receptor 1 n=1 Tax=Pyxicephalus adspersus TaxID=30357 RepID=UPI003B599287
MYREKTACFVFGFVCLIKIVYPCTFEDEHCVLECKGTPIRNNTKATVTWQKRLSFNASEMISADTDIRILVDGNVLEFWPLSLNDSGEYICTVQGKDYEVKVLNVMKKNPNYCKDDSSASILNKTKGAAAIIKYNLPDKYKSRNVSVVWYKDCELYAENKNEISFQGLKVSDSAIYTYVSTHVHQGEYYNMSSKTKLIVNDHAMNAKEIQEHVKHRIRGLESTVFTVVEIGQNVSVKCEASVGSTEDYELYWIHKREVNDLDCLIEDCKPSYPITKPCMNSKKDVGIAYIELIIPSIDEDYIKYPAECILANTVEPDKKMFVFLLREKQDIPKSVFTTSVITAVTCSVAIIFIFVLCIFFRIEIVLLYRNIIGLDETNGDSKEYDAYISFERYSSFKGEERDFALNTLVPVLENCFGFNLCIFDRDVTPGGAMVDDMNAFLEKSRRLIIIFSKNYTSDKVMYEMESGLHKAMVERNINVILIEFTPINEISFIPESFQLLKTTNKVKWKGEKSRPLNSRFWKKIKYLMPAKPALRKSDFFTRRKYRV